MSSPEPGEDQAYFLAIESFFIELRGAPLLLSPEDWRMARTWREEGIPLAVVRQGVGEVFEQRKAKAKPGRVNSLRYCRAAVETAWRNWREISATTTTDAVDPLNLGKKLEELAAAVPARVPGREALAERILALEGPLDEVEKALARLDSELLQALAESLDTHEREALERDLASSIERLAARMSRSQAIEVEATLRKQLLRRQHRVPILSLFSA